MARTIFKVKQGISVADDNSASGYPLVPVGSLIQYAGSTSPEGWLLCDGTAVSRTTYPNLWALVGTTYGSGDGTTTFNVPDTRSRVPIGAGTGTGLTTRTLGATGGAESVVIASGNLPTHAHTLSAHTHTSTAHAHTLSAHTHTSSIHSHTLSAHTHGISIDSNNFNTGTVSAWHTHSGTTGYANVDHNHVANRSAIAATGTARLVVSTTTSDSGFTTAGGGNVHTHTMTTGNPDNNHDHNANHAHTGGVGPPSNDSAGSTIPPVTGGPNSDTTNSVTPTATGGPNSDTTGNGGFTNTALAIMNPFLALNFIIKY